MSHVSSAASKSRVRAPGPPSSSLCSSYSRTARARAVSTADQSSQALGLAENFSSMRACCMIWRWARRMASTGAVLTAVPGGARAARAACTKRAMAMKDLM